MTTSAAGGSCGCAAGQASPARGIRETVRERYAAAARAAAHAEPTGCCTSDVSISDEHGNEVFGGALYDATEADGAPTGRSGVAGLRRARPPSPTCTRARPSSISAPAPAPTC